MNTEQLKQRVYSLVETFMGRKDVDTKFSITGLTPLVELVKSIISLAQPMYYWGAWISANDNTSNMSKRVRKKLNEKRFYVKLDSKIINVTYLRRTPDAYVQIPELSSSWFKTGLLQIYLNDITGHNAKEIVKSWNHDYGDSELTYVERKKIEANSMMKKVLNVFCVDTFLSKKPNKLSLKIKLLWLPVTTDNGDSESRQNDYFKQSILSNRDMDSCIALNNQLVDDYANYFDAKLTSNDIALITYRYRDESIISITVDQTTSGWYTAALYYVMRKTTSSIVNPKSGSLKKLPSSHIALSARNIRINTNSCIEVVRLGNISTAINTFLSDRISLPLMREPMVKWWVNFRDSLLRGLPKDILGNSNRIELLSWTSAQNALPTSEKDVDDFLNLALSSIEENNYNFFIDLVYHDIDINLFTRSPGIDERIGTVRIDYCDNSYANNYNPLRIRITFDALKSVVRGQSSRKFSDLLAGGFTPEDAFSRVVAYSHNNIRRVYEQYDSEDNEEGELNHPHPFIEADSLCVGDWDKIIYGTFASGDICGMIISIHNWLTTYTSSSAPYRNLREYMFGAKPEFVKFLSRGIDDSTLSLFDTESCARHYHPRPKQCREANCVFTTPHDEYLAGYNGRICTRYVNQLEREMEIARKEKEEQKKVSSREKEELKKVEVMMANKLTREAMSTSTQNETEVTHG